MRVFKFGGASVKNAAAIINVGNILQAEPAGPLVVVISAMGKTTNALEGVMRAWWNGQSTQQEVAPIREAHLKVAHELLPEDHPVHDELDNLFDALELLLEKPLERNFDMVYDQVVSFGELASTRLVSAYLNSLGWRNRWIDARNLIITNDLWREARVDWELTESLIARKLPPVLREMPVITQGFIGSTKDNRTTTLGREGSDFTAAIFAFALDAEEVVIWKDVPGILNADPRKFENTVKFDTLSYEQAVEMTYYGATVLHPKTIKPLQNKHIPLHVRSFVHPEQGGTRISTDVRAVTDVPIIILKENQLVLSLCTRDFSFIAEDSIKRIFEEVVQQGMKVNLMQNSAISFYICIDDRESKVQRFIENISTTFEVTREGNLELLTIKSPDTAQLNDLLKNREIILEQKSGDTVQFVIR